MKQCIACGEEIHPKRVEILPDTLTCVKCSSTGRKAGMSVVLGEGDHTYNEIVILEPEEFKKVKELEQKLYGTREDIITHPEDGIDEIEDDEEIDQEIEELNKLGLENLDLNIEEEE